jgi:hypothetical protein
VIGLLVGGLRTKLFARTAKWNVAHFATWLMVLAVVFLDPGHFFEWFLD